MFLSKLTNRKLLTFLLVGGMGMFMLTFMNSCQTECKKECCTNPVVKPDNPNRMLGENEVVVCDTLNTDIPNINDINVENFIASSNPMKVFIDSSDAKVYRSYFDTYVSGLSYPHAQFNVYDTYADKRLKTQLYQQWNTNKETGQQGFRISYGLLDPAPPKGKRVFLQIIYPTDSDRKIIYPVGSGTDGELYGIMLPVRDNIAGSIIHCPPYCD